jgi:hypothetical protein
MSQKKFKNVSLLLHAQHISSAYALFERETRALSLSLSLNDAFIFSSSSDDDDESDEEYY